MDVERRLESETGHSGAIGQNHIGSSCRGKRGHRPPNAGRVEQRVRQRLSRREAVDTAPNVTESLNAKCVNPSAQPSHVVGARFLAGIVHERDNLEIHPRGERPNDVEGANPVSAIGSVWQPMRHEDDPHAGRAPRRVRTRTTRAGTPAATTPSGNGRVTTAPAPTMLSRPTSAMMIAALPIQEPAPIRIIRSEPD